MRLLEFGTSNIASGKVVRKGVSRTRPDRVIKPYIGDVIGMIKHDPDVTLAVIPKVSYSASLTEPNGQTSGNCVDTLLFLKDKGSTEVDITSACSLCAIHEQRSWGYLRGYYRWSILFATTYSTAPF